LERADLVRVAQGEADLVEAVDEAVLAEGIDLEAHEAAPSGVVTICFSRSTTRRNPGKAATSWNSRSTSLAVSATGSRPFLQQLSKKRSAYEGATTARNPSSPSAQGACSRELPQPKFLRAIRMLAPR